jgi:hypothetical protein
MKTCHNPHLEICIIYYLKYTRIATRSPCAPNLNIFDGTLCATISHTQAGHEERQKHFCYSHCQARLLGVIDMRSSPPSSPCIIMYKIFIEKMFHL